MDDYTQFLMYFMDWRLESSNLRGIFYLKNNDFSLSGTLESISEYCKYQIREKGLIIDYFNWLLEKQ